MEEKRDDEKNTYDKKVARQVSRRGDGVCNFQKPRVVAQNRVLRPDEAHVDDRKELHSLDRKLRPAMDWLMPLS